MAAKFSEAEVVEQIPKTYVYDGLQLGLLVTPAAMDAVKKVKLYHDDLLVISYPKSGKDHVYQNHTTAVT